MRTLLIMLFLLQGCSTIEKQKEGIHQIKVNTKDSKVIFSYLISENKYEQEYLFFSNIEEDIKKTLFPFFLIDDNKNLETEVNVNKFYIVEKKGEKNRTIHSDFSIFVIYGAMKPVLKFPLYSELELDYKIFCNNREFKHSFKSKEKIFYLSLGFDILKLLAAVVNNNFSLTSLQGTLAIFLTIFASAYTFSDGPFAYKKAYEDALNQFKEDFKMNLEKTAQACRVEGKL